MTLEEAIKKAVRSILDEEEEQTEMEREEETAAQAEGQTEEAEQEKKQEEPKRAYLLQVTPMPGCDKKMEPEEDEQKGFECDSYVYITFKNGKARSASIKGTTEMLKKCLMKDDPVQNAIRAAAMMAEAELRVGELVTKAGVQMVAQKNEPGHHKSDAREGRRMSTEERKEKFEKLFDHIWGVAMQQNGSENLLKYVDALRGINWAILEFERENGNCFCGPVQGEDDTSNG